MTLGTTMISKRLIIATVTSFLVLGLSAIQFAEVKNTLNKGSSELGVKFVYALASCDKSQLEQLVPVDTLSQTLENSLSFPVLGGDEYNLIRFIRSESGYTEFEVVNNESEVLKRYALFYTSDSDKISTYKLCTMDEMTSRNQYEEE